MIKAIYYDEGVPDGGRTYCGITEYSENMEGCFTKNIDDVSCKKCLMFYNKEKLRRV
jgi:hypothetical protein